MRSGAADAESAPAGYSDRRCCPCQTICTVSFPL